MSLANLGARAWFARRRDAIVPWLLIAVVALLGLNFVKRGILTAATLTENQLAIETAGSVVQSTLLILAGIMSYYRFFRGRTFVTRADIAVDVKLITTPGDANVHSIVIDVRNVGTLSIWHPKPSIVVFVRSPRRDPDARAEWIRLDSPDFATHEYATIDSGETASFNAVLDVPKRVWCVNYQVSVRDAEGFEWGKSIIVPNNAA